MRDLKVLTGKTVVVASDAVTLRGVVESCTRAFLTLHEAQEVGRPDPVPIAGAVLVPIPKVNYVQVVV